VAGNTIKIKAILDDKVSRGLDKIGKSMDKSLGKGSSASFFGNVGAKAVAKGFSLATDAASAAVGMFFKAVDALKRIEIINTQTAAAIKSTGGAANVTATQVEKMAGAIEDLTGVEAETVQEGENLLLTFTGIKNQVGEGNDIFNQATRAMTDMAVAMAKGDGAAVDMKSTAIQLGKALNDPILGMTALRKVGVSFTAAQRDQVKAMVQTGDMMGAQKLILAELTTEFGGSAEAYGTTNAGKIAKANHRIGASFERLATSSLPMIADAFSVLADEVERLTGAETKAGETTDWLGSKKTLLGQALHALVDGLKPYEERTAQVEERQRRLVIATNDVSASSREMKGRIFGATQAIVGMGDEAEETAKAVIRSKDDIVGAWRDTRSQMETITKGFASSVYDPIIKKQELVALQAESRSLREQRAAKKTSDAEKAQLTLQLANNDKRETELLATLANLGDADAAMQLERRAREVLANSESSAANRRWAQGVLTQLGLVRKGYRSIYDAARQSMSINPFQWVNKFGGGARASGGPVFAGQTYTVGEEGPERLVMGPSGGGYVLPNKSGGGGKGGMTIHVMKVYLDRKQIATAIDEENYWLSAGAGGSSMVQ
jgi:hypothetical protein